MSDATKMCISPVTWVRMEPTSCSGSTEASLLDASRLQRSISDFNNIWFLSIKPAAHPGTSICTSTCPETFPNVPAADLALVPCWPSWSVCELNSQLGPGDWESRAFACRRAVGDVNPTSWHRSVRFYSSWMSQIRQWVLLSSDKPITKYDNTGQNINNV